MLARDRPPGRPVARGRRRIEDLRARERAGDRDRDDRAGATRARARASRGRGVAVNTAPLGRLVSGQSGVYGRRALRPRPRLLDLRGDPHSRSSRPDAATSWTPTGSPSAVMCSGSEIAGWPVVLKPAVKIANGVARTIGASGLSGGRVVLAEPRRRLRARRRQQQVEAVVGPPGGDPPGCRPARPRPRAAASPAPCAAALLGERPGAAARRRPARSRARSSAPQ